MAGALLLLSAGESAAQSQCLDAYDQSQRTRRRGELIAAREHLLVCAQADCPEPVMKECTRWLAEVNASLPSIVLGAKDAQGRDAIDVKVYDGDKLISTELDGRSISIDPGTHALRFVFPDGTKVRERILVREAEKNRAVVAHVPRSDPKPAKVKPQRSPAAATSSGPPTATIVLGAIGAVALGSFAYFGIRAKQDADELDARCAPRCPTSDTDAVKQKALIADISLLVGVSSLAAGTYLWIQAAPSQSDTSISTGSVGLAGRF
ncbi:MAG: hypothetical protein R3B13_15125 [Polyangiaceae bacterium]